MKRKSVWSRLGSKNLEDQKLSKTGNDKSKQLNQYYKDVKKIKTALKNKDYNFIINLVRLIKGQVEKCVPFADQYLRIYYTLIMSPDHRHVKAIRSCLDIGSQVTSSTAQTVDYDNMRSFLTTFEYKFKDDAQKQLKHHQLILYHECSTMNAKYLKVIADLH